VGERVSQFWVFEAVQLRVPPGPEFQIETVWEFGFDPPTVPVKEMFPGYRSIAGPVRVRLTAIV